HSDQPDRAAAAGALRRPRGVAADKHRGHDDIWLCGRRRARARQGRLMACRAAWRQRDRALGTSDGRRAARRCRYWRASLGGSDWSASACVDAAPWDRLGIRVGWTRITALAIHNGLAEV